MQRTISSSPQNLLHKYSGLSENFLQKGRASALFLKVSGYYSPRSVNTRLTGSPKTHTL